MLFSKKRSISKYEKEKKKQEKELAQYNKKQEELDSKLKKEKQKYTFKSILSKLKFETYTKRLVGVVVFVALVDLQLSYVLAFMDKIQIAESLSIQICTTLLGTVFIYAIRAYFDTKAEKRDEMIKQGYDIPDSKVNVAKSVIDNKFREVINNSGLGEHVNIEEELSNDNVIPETENPDDCG